MLPNFRKAEPDAAQGQTTVAANDQTGKFPARPGRAAPQRGDRSAISIIGPDLVITGNLVSKGEVQVDGKVEGDIHGSHVIVGQNADISGGIVAEEIVIRGHVNGSIRGKRVMLQASSQVDGDIYHNALSIEQGAMFEGKSRRTTDDPRDGAKLSLVAPPRTAPVVQLAYDEDATASVDDDEASVTIVPPRLPGQ